MKRKIRVIDRSQGTWATTGKIIVGLVGVAVGMMLVRSLPDLIRYVKMEKM